MQISPVFPKSLDSTMISAYTDCPQKFYYEYCLKLAYAGTSPDLHAGGALAAGFEAARNAFYRDSLSQPQAVAKGLEAFVDYWGLYEAPEKHVKQFNTVAYLLGEYFEAWPMATDHIQPYRNPQNHRPAVEFTFAMPTEITHPETGMPLLYSGRCDLVGVITDMNNAAAVVDEKTAKSMGPSFRTKWDMRGQFYGYARAAIEADIPVEFAVVRGIQIMVTDTNFEEIIIPTPAYRIDRWWRATNQKAKEITLRWDWMQKIRTDIKQKYGHLSDCHNLMNKASHDVWTFSFGEPCEQYGGCTFKRSCLRENPHLFYTQYETREWDPLAKDPAKSNGDALKELSSVEAPEELLNLLEKADAPF